MGGPLAGITVVALEQAVAAPMCTRVLADFGARVIKIENPEGGDFARDYDEVARGQAAHFVWCNRGKESVTLNLKSLQGMAILHRILDDADVMVSNLAPGATARLELAAPDLAERHPRLISVEIDGFGEGGPLSHKRAYDLLVQAEAGVCAVTGHPGAPAKPGPPVADVTTGLHAALSVMALLCGRERGESGGAQVALSLFDTMADMMGYHLTYARYTGIDQQPLGVSSPAVAPYGNYRTADGQTVVIGTTNDGEWQRLARMMLGRPDLADDPRFSRNSDRCEHRELLDAEIGEWCSARDLAQIQLIADEARIGNSRLNLPTEVLDHPQLTKRQRWSQVDTPNGPVLSLLPPPVISGCAAPMGAVPGLGQHTESVLGQLGFSATDVCVLRAEGAVGPVYSAPRRSDAGEDLPSRSSR